MPVNKKGVRTPHDIYILSKSVMLPRTGGSVAVGRFSSHWAACAALIRLRQPEFKSLGGDRESDLAEEVLMRKNIAGLMGEVAHG